jgi:hypothetical protein
MADPEPGLAPALRHGWHGPRVVVLPDGFPQTWHDWTGATSTRGSSTPAVVSSPPTPRRRALVASRSRAKASPQTHAPG